MIRICIPANHKLGRSGHGRPGSPARLTFPSFARRALVANAKAAGRQGALAVTKVPPRLPPEPRARRRPGSACKRARVRNAESCSALPRPRVDLSDVALREVAAVEVPRTTLTRGEVVEEEPSPKEAQPVPGQPRLHDHATRRRDRVQPSSIVDVALDSRTPALRTIAYRGGIAEHTSPWRRRRSPWHSSHAGAS